MHRIETSILAPFIAVALAFASPSFAAPPNTEKSAEQALPTQVNINTADASTLAAMLDGIGESRAKAIVDYRAANGPFKSADDLVAVKGIGQSVVDRNRARIKVK
jgi:competence protein ComEA